MILRLLLVAVLVFMFGCSKSGQGTGSSKGAVSAGDLYKESMQAAVAYSKGEPTYKPTNDAIHITARKQSQGEYDANTGEPSNKEALKISAAAPVKEGLVVEYHVTVPLEWLKGDTEKLASLDKEFEALRVCVADSGKNEAKNPLTDKSTCHIANLTYNGHPGATYEDKAGAPHMNLWIYNESKTVASNQ